MLFPHGDSKVLATEIRKLCEDEIYAEEVAGRCMERAKMFDVETMAQNYWCLYQK